MLSNKTVRIQIIKSLGLLGLGICGFPVDAARAATTELLVNGSFESDFTGWTASGNQSVQSAAPYVAIDGTKLAVFNGSNLAPSAVLSQTFATVAGQTYTLAFSAGVLAYNTNSQTIQATVTGSSSLLSQTIIINGLGGGSINWQPQTFTFVANSASSTLTFRDLSTVTNSLDLLLDNVRVTYDAPPPIVPTVALYSMNLGWDAVPDTTLTGYRVHVGTQSLQYTTVYDAGLATVFPIPALEYGKTYYFVVSAIGSSGLESVLSDELAVTIATPPLPTGGQVVLAGSGQPGLQWTFPRSALSSSPDFIVSASPDLVNWTPVGTVSSSQSTGGDAQTLQFAWPIQTPATQMFYRLTARNWIGDSRLP